MRFNCIKGRKTVAALTVTAVAGIILLLDALPLAAAPPALTDVSITDAVEDELRLDEAVSSGPIDVLTVGGIVTLTGSVDNLLVKERSARIAKTVKGVRAVVNEIQVEPSILRTDRQIREDVEQALLFDPATESVEVAVRVKDNRVTLTGTVDSWQERELCAKVAKGVKGIIDLTNELEVAWTRDRPDSEIRAEVEAALKWNALVDQALIDVAVKDGTVQLSGIVGSAAEKSEAYMDAFVSGVASVDTSKLEVRRWARDEDLRDKKYAAKSAQQIKDALEAALLYDPRVSAFEITPQVTDDGTKVILRGMVDNLKAKRAAAQDARNTVGVWNVENRIKVRPVLRPSDQKIKNDIGLALLRDPYVEKFKISATVNNGVVNLAGTVDSYFEKAQAEDVVSRVKGVVHVNNRLEVQQYGTPYTYDPYVDNWYFNDTDWYSYKPAYSGSSDFRIAQEIRDQLFWSPFVDDTDITVSVDDGEATLTGTVDSYMEYGAAQDNAYEGGAIFVDNDLVVE
jgi:osmotically-inducible protein OsmY